MTITSCMLIIFWEKLVRKKDLMHEISCMMINIARMQGGKYMWKDNLARTSKRKGC